MAGTRDITDNVLYMYYRSEDTIPGERISAENSETRQVYGCLCRLWLLLRNIAILKAFS